MSYILEALKKADAERESGEVPDLHAQPLPLAAFGEVERSRAGKAWIWLGGGAVIAVLAVVAWRFSGQPAQPQAPAVAMVPVAPTPAAALVPPQPAPQAAQSVPPEPAAATAAPPAQQPPQPAVVAAPPARVEAEAKAKAEDVAVAPPPARAPRKVAQKPAPKTAPAPAESTATQTASATPTAAPAAATPTATPAAAPSAPQRVPMLAELPEDLRRQVPTMALGGLVYSPQPASRMVIVNGQVFREGNTVAPELQLEQIGQKSAVFSLRGQRFEMPY